ncbi:MAG: creatininase family protein [Clostridium sp.]
MELRTRILPKMLNSEVEEYLNHNDLIIVPVGTMEMHGGFPLDSETVISEAFALRMAEAANGLILTGLPYFYAGATASGRGTVQCSIRQGIDYLSALAHSLLRQGFKRQIYISFHGPAHMTISPMVRDFYDETGVPILYMDATMQIFQSAKDLFKSMDSFHAITVGAYQVMDRLKDVPLMTGYQHAEPQTVKDFNDILGLAYQSGSVGYYFGAPKDHMSTPDIPTEEVRQKLADEGEELINAIVDRMNMTHVASQLRVMENFSNELSKRCPWTPAAYSKNPYNR